MKLQTLKPRIKASNTSRVPVMQPGSWRAGKTTAERGYNYRWQQARELYLRAHPLCVYCERDGRTAAASIVDHIQPHQGNQELFWDEDNWQALCKTCHDGAKAKEEARRG